ncbi:hypothetical protein AVEN_274582-1 [Araneus ventricosus]|uniref:Uncharacterized protein n=1 Tax=Araneus ventricosus TaxID=182803 RepID=A0A4Y2KZZ4_ARAVE|nr:hypothetical protein AVEN_274582-1 [Araneus ventricosus]
MKNIRTDTEVGFQPAITGHTPNPQFFCYHFSKPQVELPLLAETPGSDEEQSQGYSVNHKWSFPSLLKLLDQMKNSRTDTELGIQAAITGYGPTPHDIGGGRIPLVRASSESAVSCLPKPSVRTKARSAAQLRHSTGRPRRWSGPNQTESPQPVPVQCHTRFGSQSDGPSPQNQSLSRSCGSNLPTSFTYIVQST